MENKINIAEILHDMPKGTKLYSPIYGEIELLKVNSNYTYPINITIGIDRTGTFTSDGRLYEHYHSAECILFPSSEMRDWSKFFKRGDVAIHSFNGCGVLVEEWTDDSYTSFKASVFQLKKGDLQKETKGSFLQMTLSRQVTNNVTSLSPTWKSSLVAITIPTLCK